MTKERFSLYQELEDGTVDDVAGYGNWHLEKMSEKYLSFVVTDEEQETTGWFTITIEDGGVVVEADCVTDEVM